MTNRFLKAMPYIFEHEGFGTYTNDAKDAGGPTAWGVSLRFLKSINKDIDGDGDCDFMDIKALTKENAMDIYFDNFWRNLYDKLSEKLGIKLFDVAVNAGHTRSSKLLQTALNKLGSKLVVDGAIGQNTLAEVAKYSESSLLTAYCQSQKEFYESIVKNNPTQSKFIKGWTKRSQWIPA